MQHCKINIHQYNQLGLNIISNRLIFEIKKHTTTTTTTQKAASQTKPKCIPELNTVFALDFSSFTDEQDQNQMQTLNELVTNFIPSLPIGEGMRFSVMTIDSQSTNVYQTMTADKSKLRWVQNRMRLIEVKPKKTRLSNETGSVIADGFHVASLLHKGHHKTGVPKVDESLITNIN